MKRVVPAAVPGLVFLSGHWIIHFAEEREHLGVAIGRAFAGGDGRAHIIHPDTHVFFLHIIIAGKTHALEWHVHHFAGDILLEKSASHNPMGFGGSFGFARGAVRAGHPKPCDDIPLAGERFESFVRSARSGGSHPVLHHFVHLGRILGWSGFVLSRGLVGGRGLADI